MLIDLRQADPGRSVDKNLNKEIKNIKMEMEIVKGNQSEMKNTLSEVKSILDGKIGIQKRDFWIIW